MEHAFAALKNRFQSLQELRHPLQHDKHLTYISYWVQCCLILHNMVIQFEEHCGIKSTTEESALQAHVPEVDIDHDVDGVGPGDTSYQGTPGHQVRAKSMDHLLN